jgi:hypothetical protein
MLAKKRALKRNGQEIERTPLLVPSFSSKGFPEIKKTVKYCSELIEGATLISAYDLHYEKIEPPFNFASLIFLDSGGYEASRDAELSDFGDKEHFPKPWKQEFYDAQVRAWNPGPSVTSVIVSYDHPEERLPIREQIDRANEMFPAHNESLHEILLKPEEAGKPRLPIDTIVQNIHRLADFDVIGVTEKELGNSILARMRNLAKLRRALARVDLETPIHVFGSLDTITTPMYFLAGADIFDGLTWLRFSFHEGHTVYKQNYGALKLGIGTPTEVLDGQCWNRNYYYLKEMEGEMRRFLLEGDFTCFRYHRDDLRNAWQSVREAEA